MYRGNQPGEIDFGSSYCKVEFIARVRVIGSRLHVNSYLPEKLGTHFTLTVYNEQLLRKVLLSNYPSLGFHLQIEKCEPPCTT